MKNKTEIWVDSYGIPVYQKGKRTSKNRVYLTREEFLATKMLLSGTITKHGFVFHAPLKRRVVKAGQSI